MSTTPPTNTASLPALPFNAAQVESFLENADAILPTLSFIPQVAFVHQTVVPILEGALKIVSILQASGGVDPTQLLPVLAQEFHAIGLALSPLAAAPPAPPPPNPPAAEVHAVVEPPPA